MRNERWVKKRNGPSLCGEGPLKKRYAVDYRFVPGLGASGSIGTIDFVPGFGASGSIGTIDLVPGFGASGNIGTIEAYDIAISVATTRKIVITTILTRFAVRDIVITPSVMIINLNLELYRRLGGFLGPILGGIQC